MKFLKTRDDTCNKDLVYDFPHSMRKDVFDSIVAVESKGLDGLTDEQKRYVERQVKLGKRNGNVIHCI